MNVGDVGGSKKARELASELNEVNQKKRVAEDKQPQKGAEAPSSEVSIQISALAQEINALDIRELDNRKDEKRIAELKALIDSGNYNVSSEEIAKKLILDL